MGVRGDERGQSIQIGAVILFGALIILFSTYQAFVVPQQNAEIESDHQATIDQQMQDLRNAIVSVPATGADRSVTLTLGTTYPARILALNPDPPSGTIRTVGTADPALNLTLANARATDEETADFWSGTDRSYNTGALAYEPNYNEYENPATIVYGNTLLYKEFRSGNLSVTGQRLVDGRRLTLVTLNGSLNRGSSESVSLDVQAVSASDGTITVTNEPGQNVTVSVVSRRNASVWREILNDEGQFVGDGGHVVSVTRAGRTGDSLRVINITLEQGPSYELTMAKAGVGSRVSGVNRTYLTDVRGDDRSLRQGETVELVVEVRDRYNAPVSGVRVNATAESGTVESDETTGNDGRAAFEYTAPPGTSGDVAVNFSYAVTPGAGFDADVPENVGMTVNVQKSGGTGGGGTAFSVSWADPTSDNSGAALSDCDASDCTWDVGQSGENSLTLRGRTSPSIDGITLDFGLNDSSLALLSPGSNTTDGGEATTTVTALKNATARVFVVGGGDSDRLNLTMENVTISGFGRHVVFTNGGILKSISGDGGNVVTYSTSDVKAIGPRADLDADSNLEVPYVTTGGNLEIVEEGGSDRQTIDGSGKVATSKTRLAVGDFDSDSDKEVYYVHQNNDKIYKADGSQSGTKISQRDPEADAVGGVSDIDSDSNIEIIYEGTSEELIHIDTAGNDDELVSSIGESSGVGLGDTADLNTDPNEEVVYVDGSNDLKWDEPGASSPTAITSNGPAKKSPVGTTDVDGDGEVEIVFIDNEGELAYAEPDTGSTSKITTSSGATLSADSERGAV